MPWYTSIIDNECLYVYISRPAFYLYAVLKVASGALMLSIDLEFKQPAQNLLEDVISVFRNIEIVALFIACFIMGKKLIYARIRYLLIS